MTNRVVSKVSASIVALGALVVVSGTASAQSVASDRPAGLIIFPKVEVDLIGLRSASPPGTAGASRTDTLIQITNTSDVIRRLQCYYVNATGTCQSGRNLASSPFAECRDNQDCCTQAGTGTCTPGGTCRPDWNGDDFTITLSPRMPTGWLASEGRNPIGGAGSGGVNPVTTDYFIGELKCWEVTFPDTTTGSDAVLPINANDLKGEATIVDTASGANGWLDARAYNAIGVQAVLNNGAAQNDQVMCLGATTGSTECATAEYAQCPSTVILNHPFDGTAQAGIGMNAVSGTRVSFAPCSENFAEQDNQTVTSVQFLVFNEFEQRFSASTRVNCFRDVLLSNIDQPPSNATYSIWSAAVQGTVVGQTRIRGVTGAETNAGHGLLAIAEEFHGTGAGVTVGAGIDGTAFNLNYSGLNAGKGDFLRYSVTP